MNSEVEAMFEVPEGHTPKVLLGGGTNHKHFVKVWDSMVEEKVYKDMDNNASRLGLSLSPALVLIVQGDDGHVHALISLPLQKWQGNMRIHESIEESKDLRRTMDWCAGFMEVFCMNDTVTAVDLATDKVIFGDSSDIAFSIEGMVKDVRPKKDVRGTSGLDIGSVDDILGQLSRPQIEKFQTKKSTKSAVKETKEKYTRLPVKEEDSEESKLEKTRKEQQKIVDKYGFQALKEMMDRMKLPILIEDPHA